MTGFRKQPIHVYMQMMMIDAMSKNHHHMYIKWVFTIHTINCKTADKTSVCSTRCERSRRYMSACICFLSLDNPDGFSDYRYINDSLL